MLFNIRKKLAYWKIGFWKGIDLFPQRKIKKLEKEIFELRLLEEKNAEKAVESIIERYERSEIFQKRVKKNYITWKAAIRQKLIREIGCCEKCKQNVRRLTIDHIIPQSFLKDLGFKPEEDRDERNFRLLCSLCNSKKSKDFDFTDPRTYYLLLEYLKKVPKPEDPFKKPLVQLKKKFSVEETKQIDVSKTLKGTPYDPDNF